MKKIKTYCKKWTNENNKKVIQLDPVTDIIGRFLSWLGSRIFTFGNVSKEIFSHHRAKWIDLFPLYIVLTRKSALFPFEYTVFTILTP